ncbi:MAG TPA: thioredoxin domain-containing protein [Flavobacterium sp.]
MKYRLLFLLIVSFAVLSCNGQASKNVKTIEPAAFAEKIAATPNAQILDVRTPEEYVSGHIDNAANVNWNGNDFVAKVAALDKTKPVFVYCKSGGRSKQAAAKLEELGFTTIYELQGGMLKWDAAGLSKPSDKIIGMCSQEYGELLNTDKKVLISFYAEWCAPCKKMTPYILQMQKDLADKVTIVRLNADENKTLISEMKISELPTLLLYENKEVKWKHSGFISEEDLKKQLQ